MVAGLLFAQASLADYSIYLEDFQPYNDPFVAYIQAYNSSNDGDYEMYIDAYYDRCRAGCYYGSGYFNVNVYQSTVDLGPSPIPFPIANNYPGWYHQENFATLDNYKIYNLVPRDTYYSSDWGYFVASSSGNAVFSTQVGAFSVIEAPDSVIEAPEIDANLAGLSIGLLSGILFLFTERRRATKI